MPAAPDLPAWLSGAWTVERDINGGRGTFRGTADFAPDGGALRWSEAGRLTLDGYAGPATRVLFVHAAQPWEVRFDDGRPFHDLDLSTGRCQAVHLCGEDIYRGSYDVLTADELLVRWAVTGPGREDTITSRYRRRPPGLLP